jgi:hypothetical protein
VRPAAHEYGSHVGVLYRESGRVVGISWPPLKSEGKGVLVEDRYLGIVAVVPQ